MVSPPRKGNPIAADRAAENYLTWSWDIRTKDLGNSVILKSTSFIGSPLSDLGFQDLFAVISTASIQQSRSKPYLT